MTIKAIVELHARKGKREELIKALDELHEKRKNAPGFVGFSRYEVIDDPEKLIEVVEWETREARQAWMEQNSGTGKLSSVVSAIRGSFNAVTVRKLI
jgi:heme-degrading monooxygenase HmoA